MSGTTKKLAAKTKEVVYVTFLLHFGLSPFGSD